jgi:hypothetical protein
MPPDGAARREAIRASVLSRGTGTPPTRKERDTVIEACVRPALPLPRAVPPTGTPTPRHEALIDLDELRRRLGGIGITLARRVLEELPVIRLGDRVLIREASLDEYIRALDARARQQAAVP